MTYSNIFTERLLIRPTIIEDAEFIFSLMNSPGWIKFIGDRNIKTIQDAENYIRNRIQPQYQELGFSTNTVLLNKDKIKIGTCGLHKKEGINGYHIGFVFLPEFHKMGYAFEAANALIDFTQNTLNETQLSAIVLEENTNSRMLLERLGFNYIKQITFEDAPEELMLYEVRFF